MSSGAGVASGRRAATIATTGRSSLAEAARMFGKSGSALFGLALVAVLGAAALLAPLLAPHDPDAIDTARRLAPPLTAGHPLGTDEFGRDLLSRLLHGARTSLVVGLAATALAAAAGSICGLLAGFVGRWVDQVVMRSIDTLMAFPYFLLAIAIIATLGPGLVNGMVAVAIVNIPFYGRIVRATVLAVKQTEYVEAARALGVSELRLSLTHVLRNCLAPLIVAVTLNVGGMITALAGLAIFLAVLGFNLLGDGLRDALDPRLR
jgi:peptide/nickel transport system permease protein